MSIVDTNMLDTTVYRIIEDHWLNETTVNP